MDPPVVRAPPLRQRIARIALWFGVGAFALAAAEFWFFPWLRGWLSVKDDAELLFRLRATFGALALGMLAAAAWAFRLGRRVLRAGQWPLPGTFVLRDTPVVGGRGARLRAWALIGWAVLAGGLAVYAAVLPDLMLRH